MTTVITRTIARMAVPIILVVSIALFLQGHNQPGGGFIAGVLTAAAFALVSVAYSLEFLRVDVLDRGDESSVDSTTGRLVAGSRSLLALGLALAAGSGLVPMLDPAILGGESAFLSQSYWILHDVPLYGEVEVASAIAFDLGVYLTVVGALLVVLSVVGSQ